MRPQKPRRPRLEKLEPRLLLATFTVTRVDDTASNVGFSLRQAIQAANATVGPDLIDFNIPGQGAKTIFPTSPLPDITDPVMIDGTTQPGYNGPVAGPSPRIPHPIVVLDGLKAGVNATGLSITAGSSTVKGLAIGGFADAGIELASGGSNLITANYIGTDYLGTTPRGNAQEGILLRHSSSNTIGGASLEVGNLVSANYASGIHLENRDTTTNLIAANLIGTDPRGETPGPGPNGELGTVDDLPLGNGGDGIFVEKTSINVIGGFNALETDRVTVRTLRGNIIGNNGGSGIRISGGEGVQSQDVPYGNQIFGNFVGVSPFSHERNGNRIDGISVTRAIATTIGGPTPEARNVISGNSGWGISVDFVNDLLPRDQIPPDVQVGPSTIQGNLIGPDPSGERFSGLTAFRYYGGNFQGGISLDETVSFQIGGDRAGEGNVISGNGGPGIEIAGDIGGFANIQGNKIGTDAAGAATVLPGRDERYGINYNMVMGNAGSGILIDDLSIGNTIGGATPGASNLISGNARDEIRIGQGSYNLVAGNLLGTDLSGRVALRFSPNSFPQTTGNGISISDQALNNTIGGPVTAEGRLGLGNLISGHVGAGVLVEGAYNQILGNFIGTDATGQAQLPNDLDGIRLQGGSNTIGGTGPGAGNLISGNGSAGIRLGFGAVVADGNVVAGNRIGIARDGITALPNGTYGLDLGMGTANTIGGTTPGARNVISGNVKGGVRIQGPSRRTMSCRGTTSALTSPARRPWSEAPTPERRSGHFAGSGCSRTTRRRSMRRSSHSPASCNTSGCGSTGQPARPSAGWRRERAM